MPERRLTDEELVKQYAKGPPVDWDAMTCTISALANDRHRYQKIAPRPMDFILPEFLITSGARYSGVPQSVYVSPIFSSM